VKTYDVLMLGAGVQSTTLLLLAIDGKLPKPDIAIFADTKWEGRHTYEHLVWLEGCAAAAGIRVDRCSKGNIKEDALNSRVRAKLESGYRWVSLPYYVTHGDGEEGIIRRQCTKEYKIDEIDRHIRRELLGLKPRQRFPKDVHIRKWFGISADEAMRMKPARNRWDEHVYPLIEMLDPPWKRGNCVAYLEKRNPDRRVPRSSCTGCPFKNTADWRELIEYAPEEFEEACQFDEAIRNTIDDGEAFIHPRRKPLREIDFSTLEDHGQQSLFGNDCSGHCGV
jgi:hypothetical protein